MEEKMIDYNEIERLAKVVTPVGNDINSIYGLYKKYVDINATPPSINGCTSCGNSVVNYWRKLMLWWNDNKNHFVIQ